MKQESWHFPALAAHISLFPEAPLPNQAGNLMCRQNTYLRFRIVRILFSGSIDT